MKVHQKVNVVKQIGFAILWTRACLSLLDRLPQVPPRLPPRLSFHHFVAPTLDQPRNYIFRLTDIVINEFIHTFYGQIRVRRIVQVRL